MPFTFMIYPDEKVSVPKEGDTFRVTSVEQGVVDIHWGTGTYVGLIPISDCEWTYSPDNVFYTLCGKDFTFPDLLYRIFCPMCGGRIILKEKQ